MRNDTLFRGAGALIWYHPFVSITVWEDDNGPRRPSLFPNPTRVRTVFNPSWDEKTDLGIDGDFGGS